MKILITDGLESEAISTLRKLHEVDVQELDSKGLLGAIPEYHALIVRSRTIVSKPVLTRATNLKVVGRAGVGVDNIDVAEATARKIVVVNAPTASTISVAELALGHMISLLRHLTEADRSVKDGKWEKTKFEGRELFGKTLGLVGSGRIGAEVAKRAEAFGMRVIAYDPYLSPPTAKALGIQLVDKDAVFREADVVSVHAALTPETKGMIAAAEFAMMKRGTAPARRSSRRQPWWMPCDPGHWPAPPPTCSRPNHRSGVPSSPHPTRSLPHTSALRRAKPRRGPDRSSRTR